MVNLGSSYGGGDENVDLNEASTVVLYLFLSQRMTSTDRAVLILLKCPTCSTSGGRAGSKTNNK